jgi:hypothetical protein
MMAFVLVVAVAFGQNCVYGEPATVVFGQLGRFTSAGFQVPPSANSLSAPEGVAVDSANNVYIADPSDSRVLIYAPGSTTASRVFGQLGSFTSAIANNGGISAISLSSPQGLAVDSAGNVSLAE